MAEKPPKGKWKQVVAHVISGAGIARLVKDVYDLFHMLF
jgi:hypothetical protein